MDVCSPLPIDGVDFIMGNDLAGGEVYPTPEVVTVPIVEPLSDDLVKEHPGVFCACFYG